MHTTRSLTVSHSIYQGGMCAMHTPCHAHPPCNACPRATHATFVYGQWWLVKIVKQEVFGSNPHSYLCWNTHVGKVTGHYAGHIHQQKRCTRGESQGTYISYMLPPSTNKAAHSGFETQRRRHQKYDTGVYVAWKNGHVSHKKFLKKIKRIAWSSRGVLVMRYFVGCWDLLYYGMHVRILLLLLLLGITGLQFMRGLSKNYHKHKHLIIRFITKVQNKICKRSVHNNN